MRASDSHDISSAEFRGKGGFLLCTAGSARAVVNGCAYRLVRGTVMVLTPLVRVDEWRPEGDFASLPFIDDLKTYYPLFHLIADTGIPLMLYRNPFLAVAEAELAGFGEQYARIERKREQASASSGGKEKSVEEYALRLLRQQAMLDIVVRLLRLAPERAAASRREAIVYRFILRLHECCRQQRQVAHYAAEASLSPGRFSKIVREVTGVAPSQWIADVTVTYAKISLEKSGLTIKEIASALNFPEQFTFRKYFKSHVGLSPKEYRLRFRANRMPDDPSGQP